jgi:general secretion pathway protein E
MKLIEDIFKAGLINKDDLLNLIKKYDNSKITVETLLANNLLSKKSLYDFFLSKIKSGKLLFSDIDNLDKEGLDATSIYKYIANELNIEYVDLNDTEVDSALLEKIPISILIKNRALVVEEDDLNILIVFADPLDLASRDAVSRYFSNKLVKVGISRYSDINNKLLQIETYDSLYSYVEDVKKDLLSTAESDEDESPAVLKLIELILKSSIVSRASDIHIEVTEKNCIVRDRVDGMLQQRFMFDKVIFGPLASRIKLLSQLDIAEKRKPQDGRFNATIVGKEFDFRVSTLPTLIGESIVMRILDKSKTLITLEDMGMNDTSYTKFKDSIASPYGIVLVTGPTGSGKTTTLYASLNAIKSVKDKIITVEDPVEYQMSGIQQVQVNNSAGLTFSSSLRSILRQDPDKIMIGEIRDTETLRIAIQAAMTGHLVLSTLHTNDAISAIYRMIDMGIESYLVSGSLIAIQAQRLVRKICPHCKVESSVSGNILESIKPYVKSVDNLKFYKGQGCRECFGSGYVGREMISEVLTISSQMASMIASGAPKEKLEIQAINEGFKSMFEDGIEKALNGKTTIDEIFRVARL